MKNITKYDDLVDWRRLPFVSVNRGGGSEGISFWNVIPTGDYALDVATGQKYAQLLLDYIRMSSDTPILARVIDAIGSLSDSSGIEWGFLSSIGLAASGRPRTCTETTN